MNNPEPGWKDRFTGTKPPPDVPSVPVVEPPVEPPVDVQPEPPPFQFDALQVAVELVGSAREHMVEKIKLNGPRAVSLETKIALATASATLAQAMIASHAFQLEVAKFQASQGPALPPGLINGMRPGG